MSEPIPVSEWRAVLANVTGHVTPKGTTGDEQEMRLSTAELVALLGAPNGFATWVRISKAMNSIGWSGPVTHRVNGVMSRGYYRPIPGSERAPEPPAEASAAAPVPAAVAATKRPAELSPNALARKLEKICDLGLDEIAEILALPTRSASGKIDGNVLRAKTAAAGIAVTSQLRADESRLRQKGSGDVLERLLKLVRAERKNIPAAGATTVTPHPQNKRVEQLREKR